MAAKKNNIKGNGKNSTKIKGKKGKKEEPKKVAASGLKKKKAAPPKKEKTVQAKKEAAVSPENSAKKKSGKKKTEARSTKSIAAEVKVKKGKVIKKPGARKSPVVKPVSRKKDESIEGKKEETASWKFFEKNGSVQIKIYTESQAIFSKLVGIHGIQKGARYFVKGHQVGADFIVPLDIAESACSIAGVKIPKISIRKPD